MSLLTNQTAQRVKQALFLKEVLNRKYIRLN